MKSSRPEKDRPAGKEGVPRSIRILLDGLIDYAGLFPPAALTMEQAVRSYAAYRRGNRSWIVGRFVVPVPRLDALEGVAAGVLAEGRGDSTWLLSAVPGNDLQAEFARILDFNTRYARSSACPAVQIDTVELKVSRPEDIAAAAPLIPRGIQAYFEVQNSVDPAPLVAEIARARMRGKLRTGGLVPESVPSAAEVERFLRACAEAKLPFKATAGLHHPVRAVYPLDSTPHSPSWPMHGFLNVFLASACVRSGMEPAQTVRLLEEQSIETFRFDGRGASWRSHRISLDDLRSTRRSFAISFGSCSIEEPLNDLENLGLLPGQD